MLMCDGLKGLPIRGVLEMCDFSLQKRTFAARKGQ